MFQHVEKVEERLILSNLDREGVRSKLVGTYKNSLNTQIHYCEPILTIFLPDVDIRAFRYSFKMRIKF